MASSAITIIEQPATVECDGSEALITKNTLLYCMEGVLTNHGPADAWLKISVTSTAAATVVTTGAQAQLQCPLPAGASIDWLPHYQSIAHKTAAGTATLSWKPVRRID